jgi:putative hydroxymethylpyrimidine transport system substrate-binding protein
MARASLHPLRRGRVRLRALAAIASGACASACILASCGASGGPPTATLMLDFTPNGVHAGIYSAVHRGYDRDHGVRLDVEQPSESTDSIKLLLAGRVDFAILDIHDLAIADAEGDGLVGVMALLQQPLAAVIAQPPIHSPRELEGRTVGVTGDPSDEAVLDSVVTGAGGDPKRVKRVNIGFEAVPTMLANRVDAVTAFWDVEGVALSHARPAIHEFRVDQYGAPAYPELVLCVTRAELEHNPTLVRDVVSAIVQGYELTLRDPQASANDMVAEVPGLDRAALGEQLAVLHGAFVREGGRYGELNLPALRSWAAWEARFGIVARPPDVNAIFDPSFTRGDG